MKIHSGAVDYYDDSGLEARNMKTLCGLTIRVYDMEECADECLRCKRIRQGAQQREAKRPHLCPQDVNPPDTLTLRCYVGNCHHKKPKG